MSLVSVAVVSKDNRPLYLKDFRGSRDNPASGESFPINVFDDLAREASNTSLSASPASSGAGGCTVPPLDTEIGKSCSMDQQFVLHSALDRIEQLMEPDGLGAAWRYGRPNQLGHEAMFVGLVGQCDDLRLYAYITTTKIKIIVACEDAFLPGQADQGRAHDIALKNLMVSARAHSDKTGNRSHKMTNTHTYIDVMCCFVNCFLIYLKFYPFTMTMFNNQIKIHSLYTEYIANPFTDIHSSTIKSSRFDNGLTANVNAFNRNPALTMR